MAVVEWLTLRAARQYELGIEDFLKVSECVYDKAANDTQVQERQQKG